MPRDISGDGSKAIREAAVSGGPLPFVSPDVVGPMQKPGNPMRMVEHPVSKLNPELLRRLLRG